uniref:PH domain-containing protein n=1 Tax=Leptocylindrus danicus TaxID=163516 RepID=A0A7S2P3G9_9STRA
MSYDKQILSTSVYWSAVQAFLRKTVKETNVTEQTIRARILANRQYARHMTAMANCCEAIDDESNNTNTAQILGGETIISNGVTSHGTEEYLTLRSNGELLVRHRPKIEKNQDENDEEAVNKEPNISFNDLIMEENDRHQRIEEDVQLPQSTSNLYNGGELLGYLNEMAHSHRQVAKHFQENANKMTNDTLIEIVALRKQLSYVNYRAEALGKAVVLELRTAEHMVRDAWNAYAEIVELYENSKLGEPDDQPNQWNDMWLHEARYRVAVGLLSSCWNKCSATLSKLFNKVKDVEVERRICLRELMIQLMQRQEVEWMGLSSTGAGVLVNLASTSIEPAVIHQGLHDAIRREAKKNAQKERERILQERAQNDRDADSSQRSINNLRISSSSIPELLENKISSDDLDNDHIVPARKDEIMMEISSPLSSELLGAAQVLRRKRCSGIFKSWRSTLAITTADQYLHFFDVNCNSSSNQWKTAEMTFNELMPDVETPSEETVNISANPRKAPSRRWHKLIEPTESLFLPRCEAGIYYDESTRMHIVEIKEKKPTTGRRAFFGKKNTVKKMFIQAEHEDNLSYWADGLEQMGVKMKK